jgi:serine/threonine-protein kinase HipA
MDNVSVLNVRLHGTKIGTITHIPGDRTFFAFADDYVAHRDRPTLSLSFKDEFGDLITQWPSKQGRLLPYFSNLLPEGPLREYLAARAGLHIGREFFLLWALGRDLPGALTVDPPDGETWPMVRGEDERSARERQGNALRFSLAGVQLKFSAVCEDKASKGLTIPTEGVGGSWIVKLPSARFEGVPENEYSMLILARHIGIEVPEIALVDMDSIGNLPDGLGDLRKKALAIARFDRTPEGPLHTEDFAQVFGVYPEEKYAKASYRSIAKVLAVETGEAGIGEFIRRLTFNALIGNADMHLKNWSLVYPDRRRPRLSPAYDFVSTIAYIDDDEAALKFVRTRRFDQLDRDELSCLAAKAGIPETPVLAIVRETIGRFLDVWEAEKSHLPQDKGVTEKIDAHLKRLPIVKECAVRR